jgi:hypothetical protein
MEVVKPQIVRKPLPLTLKNYGHEMVQIKRTDVAAIYSKGHGFEVILIQKHDGYEIAGNKVEPAEHFPKNEDWGKSGWYYIGPKARQLADEKYRELNGW